MSWLYSRALVEAYSLPHCSGGERCVRSNTTQLPPACSWPDKTTGVWSRFPCGMTCELLTEKNGKAVLKWCREDSLARTFPRVEKVRELAENAPDFGEKWHALSVRYDRRLCSWKTLRSLCDEDSTSFSPTLPNWGLMRSGVLYRRTPPVLPTGGRDFGLWASTPTRVMPVESENPDNRIPATESLFGTVEGSQKRGRKVAASGIEGSANWSQMVLQLGLLPTAMLCEHYMGWYPSGGPIGSPRQMDKFRQWRSLHGIS